MERTKAKPINIRFPVDVEILLREKATEERRSISSMCSILVEKQLIEEGKKTTK